MSCKDSNMHNWQQVVPKRKNRSRIWEYAKREICKTCDGSRWSCQIEGCSKIAFQVNKAQINLSNISFHLLSSHQIQAVDYDDEVGKSGSAHNVVTTSVRAEHDDDSASGNFKQARPATAGSTLRQASLTDMKLKSLLSRLSESSSEGKAAILRFLVQNNLSFNILDSPTWNAMTQGKLDTWNASAIKLFLRKEALSQRNQFKNDILPRAPGISVTVDEWSDVQMIPWMGVTVTVVDLDFNFSMHCPGMQLIDEAPTAENLLRWLKSQLLRMGIHTEDLANICMDNASNISKAAALDPHLRDVVSFCICHLINIAVKRATMDPIHIDDCKNYDNQDAETLEDATALDKDAVSAALTAEQESMATTSSHTKTKESRKFWYYEDVEDVSERSPGEESNVPAKRTRIPSKLLQQFLSGEAVTGSHLDVADEPDSSLLTDHELGFLKEQWPDIENATVNARDAIVRRFERCREIVKYVKHHNEPKRHLEACRKKIDKKAQWEFASAMRDYDEAVSLHKEKLKEYEERLTEFQSSEHDAAEQAPSPPHKVDINKPDAPRRTIGLVTEVETRWNSLLTCVCSVIENSEALIMLWEDGYGDGIEMFSEEEWQQLEVLAKYLVRFERITNHAQGDLLLASEALVVVREFLELTTSHEDDGILVAAMRATINAHLKNHRAKLSRILSYLKSDSLAAFCACVDPRAASLKFFEKKEERAQVRSNFVAYGVRSMKQWGSRTTRYKESKKSAEPPAAKITKIIPSANSSSESQQKSFSTDNIAVQSSLSFGRFDGSSSSDENDEDGAQEFQEDELLRQAIGGELTSFIAESKSFPIFLQNRKVVCLRDEAEAVLAWWRTIASKFPNLNIVAPKLFSVRISSASAERLFSLAGLVRTALRNKMSESLFDALIAFAYNHPTLQQHSSAKSDKRLNTKLAHPSAASL